MLSNYNMTGQSMIFPPHVHVCMRESLYVRPRHDFVQRHNELRDLDPELLSAVCNDVKGEPVLQDISWEQLNRGANKAQGWSFLHMDSASTNDGHSLTSGFFQPNTMSCKSLEPQNIYGKYENERKRQYSRTVLDTEHGTFTPLIFTTTGGIG